MNMYYKDFRYSEIVSFMGRAGLKYKGRYLKEQQLVKYAIEAIIEEHKKEIDYF